MVFCYRRRVLHVKMEAAALRLAQARAPHRSSLSPQALADGPALPFFSSFKITRGRELPKNHILTIEKKNLSVRYLTASIYAKGVSTQRVNTASVLFTNSTLSGLESLNLASTMQIPKPRKQDHGYHELLSLALGSRPLF